MMNTVVSRFKIFTKYQHLFFQLVARNIKLRYRRSILGYLWSILNPLGTMIIMTIVFSAMFARGVANFPVYLLSGQLLFSFMMGATAWALPSIIGNAALFKKIYIPKYIFTLSAVTSEFFTMLFSLGALLVVLAVTRTQLTVRFLLIVLPIIELYIFCLGLGMLLAPVTVFFRDTQHLWNVFCTAWMYMTPIFYPVEMLPEWLRSIITRFNPMYFYIAAFREFTLNSGGDWVSNICRGAVAAVIMLFVGIFVFSRTKNKFILYM
ncbi:ABC transporter permease [Treponema primitia]|uniref:ABC transporter permease n=1 Tax=Treponema primitia TaxID=88058 RepID=UPI003980FA76